MRRMLIDFRILVAMVAAVLAAALLVLVGPLTNKAQAQAAAPSTLTGERLQNATAWDPTSNCTEGGFFNSDSTINFSSTGIATGPYPGTFTASGTATIDELGQLLTLTENFIITPDKADTDPTFTQVTGTKKFVSGTSSGTGTCNEYLSNSTINATDLSYTAQIQTADGATTNDEGISRLAFYDTSGLGVFDESFVSTKVVGPTPPTVPTTKEQCKDAGFEDFTSLGFKNQGECVAFVERGPKK